MTHNEEIRAAIAKRRLKYYEVAEQMHVHPATLTRWLRFELDPKRKAEILQAIRSIKL